MPRIDPLQLLKCVSVLLSPTGGIRSGEEVQRLVGLMTKYSKKLVSKCIYVSILKATETELLEMFMSAGGWNLIFTWLSDGVTAKNWPLVAELVDLLLICPVDIDKLKSNACPKLIKSLSKDVTASESVRVLACKLVELWLKVVRAEKPEPPQETKTAVQQIPQTSVSDGAEQAEVCRKDVKVPRGESSEQTVEKEVTSASDSHLPVYKITTKDGKKILTEVTSGTRTPPGSRSSVETVEDEDDDEDEDGGDVESDVIKPVKISKKIIVNRTKVSSASKKCAKLSSVDKSDVSSYDSSDSSTSSRSHSEGRRKDALGKAKKERIDAMKNKLKGKSKIGDKDEKLKDRKDKKDEVKNKINEGEKSKKEKKDGVISDKSKEDRGLKDAQIEKDKETISKLILPSISKIGKIPKKSKEEKEPPPKMQMPLDVKKPSEFKKPIEIKRPEKNFSVSVKVNRVIEGDARPKTVKTYNSKFRSTGLEEEIKPPPPRPALKKPQGPPPPTLPGPEKKAMKRVSPPPPDPQPPEKKVKPESPTEDKKVDKAGGIKLIPPKPKPMFLQESDVFMDALTAANKKEPRKKRKPSVTKEVNGPTEPKKETPQPTESSTTPPSSPVQNEKSPPLAVIKPTFKFYQDTLESDGEQSLDKEIKQEIKMETGDSDVNEADNDSENTADEKTSLSDDDEKPRIKVELTNSLGNLKGVLVHFKSRRGPKKSVCWRGDKDLEAIRYFELDETERVNVTKTFTDMKQMERINERENFQMARKLAVEDIMEERTRWTVLIPVDVSGVVVVPGKNSNEKDIQYAREKTVAPAIYFHKRAIPDTPSEPDLEIHATTDPTIIPLDDVTGSADSINDFTLTPWPEPQSHPPAPEGPANSQLPPPQTMFPVPGPVPNPYGNPGPPFNPGPPSNFMPGPAPLPPGDWRTGDGKLVPVPDMYPGPAMMPGMGPPGPMPPPVMMPPGHPDMGFPPMGMPGPPNAGHPDDMGPPPHPFGPPPFSMGGPPPPPLFPQGIPQGPQGGPPPSGNYQGGGGGGGGSGSGDSGRGGRGSWYRNNSGPYSHGGGGGSKNSNWRGGGGGGNSRGSNHGWGCNSRGICNMFLKRGFCRNNSCPYRHT